MGLKHDLIAALTQLDEFSSPAPAFEQYPTPPELAATILHRATLTGDITDRTVIDLGTGTGNLAIGAALCQAARVIGIDIDLEALAVAADNKARIDAALPIEWIYADATSPPVKHSDATVIMNPPFGAQYTARHADRRFLTAARSIGRVSYSIHNDGSEEFITAFTADHNGTITHAFAAELTLHRQFEHHTEDATELPVELYRIEWEPHDSQQNV
jgi:putative methylase